jgi:hypothetical protein
MLRQLERSGQAELAANVREELQRFRHAAQQSR